MEELLIVGRGASGSAAEHLSRVLGQPCRIVTDAEYPDPETLLANFAGTLVLSPGIREKSGILREAKRRRLRCIAELQYGAEHFPGRMIGVTGTNGKTTTVELLGALGRALGLHVVEAGNIGRGLSDVTAELLSGNLPQDTVAAVEVSSFQLEYTPHPGMSAALLTNVQSDHLDRYPGGLAEYRAVKERLFDGVAPENAIRFDDPANRRVRFDAERFYLDGRALAERAGLALRGEHNMENLAGALELLTRIAPVEKFFSPEFHQALAGFRTGHHRIEDFGVFRGIRCVEDSKATNPASVLAALRALEQQPRGRVRILLGGLDKGMDFSDLRRAAPYFAKAYITGQCRDKIARTLGDTAEREEFPAFDDAVRAMCREAKSGEIILLSPACASMDQFKNYEERGNKFVSLVRELLA